MLIRAQNSTHSSQSFGFEGIQFNSIQFNSIQFNSIQSLFPYKKYTNIKKHQNNKETKYGGKDRKANEA